MGNTFTERAFAPRGRPFFIHAVVTGSDLERLLPRVLIVDDEPGIRFALKRWFERQQWTVAEAGDGQQALTELLASDDHGESRVDLVICDLHLPLITGDDLLKRLRVDRPALAQRFIVSTGDPIEDAPIGSAFATHPHVLQKPFDLTTLRDLVAIIRQPEPNA